MPDETGREEEKEAVMQRLGVSTEWWDDAVVNGVRVWRFALKWADKVGSWRVLSKVEMASSGEAISIRKVVRFIPLPTHASSGVARKS